MRVQIRGRLCRPNFVGCNLEIQRHPRRRLLVTFARIAGRAGEAVETDSTTSEAPAVYDASAARVDWKLQYIPPL